MITCNHDHLLVHYVHVMILQKFVLMLQFQNFCFSSQLIYQHVHTEQKLLMKSINYAQILLNLSCFSSAILLYFAVLFALLHLFHHLIQFTDKIIVFLTHEKDFLFHEYHVIYYLIQHYFESFFRICSHQFLSQQLLCLCDSILNHSSKL